MGSDAYFESRPEDMFLSTSVIEICNKMSIHAFKHLHPLEWKFIDFISSSF